MAEGTKKSISLPQEMFDAAVARARAMGYGGFSEYVQYLIGEDLKIRAPHIRHEQAHLLIDSPGQSQIPLPLGRPPRVSYSAPRAAEQPPKRRKPKP